MFPPVLIYMVVTAFFSFTVRWICRFRVTEISQTWKMNEIALRSGLFPRVILAKRGREAFDFKCHNCDPSLPPLVIVKLEI